MKIEETVADLASRIDAHLERMASSDQSFAGACADSRGDMVHITYSARYRHYWEFTRETAEAYLSWLDAGHAGTHLDMEDE